MDDVAVERHACQCGLAGDAHVGRRALAEVEVAQLVGSELAHSSGAGLQVRFGLDVADLLRGGVLHRRDDGPGRRIVAGVDRQRAEVALPRLIERNDRARHRGFVELLAAAAFITSGFGAFGAVAAGTFSAGFTAGLGTFGTAAFGVAHLGVRDPARERGWCRLQGDRRGLARSQIHRSRRSEFGPVREVDLDPDPCQGVVRRVLDCAGEGVARCVVVHDQPCAAPNHVEGLVRCQLVGCGFFAAFGTGALTATGVLTASTFAASLRGFLTYGGRGIVCIPTVENVGVVCASDESSRQ